jgi:hypothetical protein
MPPAHYEYLPNSTEDKYVEQWEAKARRDRVKTRLVQGLAILAVMLAAFKGLQAFAASSARFLHAPPCHGLQRNLSTLPSHYTLPSGDKIPAVALGTANGVRYSVLVWGLPNCFAY